MQYSGHSAPNEVFGGSVSGQDTLVEVPAEDAIMQCVAVEERVSPLTDDSLVFPGRGEDEPPSTPLLDAIAVELLATTCTAGDVLHMCSGLTMLGIRGIWEDQDSALDSNRLMEYLISHYEDVAQLLREAVQHAFPRVVQGTWGSELVVDFYMEEKEAVRVLRTNWTKHLDVVVKDRERILQLVGKLGNNISLMSLEEQYPEISENSRDDEEDIYMEEREQHYSRVAEEEALEKRRTDFEESKEAEQREITMDIGNGFRPNTSRITQGRGPGRGGRVGTALRTEYRQVITHSQTPSTPRIMQAEWIEPPKIPMEIGNLIKTAGPWNVKDMLEKLQTSGIEPQHLNKQRMLILGGIDRSALGQGYWIQIRAVERTAELLIGAKWADQITIRLTPRTQVADSERTANVRVVENLEEEEVPLKNESARQKKHLFTVDGLGVDDQVQKLYELLRKHMKLDKQECELIKILPRGGLLCKATEITCNKISTYPWEQRGLSITVNISGKDGTRTGIPMTVFGVQLHHSISNLIHGTGWEGSILKASRIMKLGQPTESVAIRVKTDAVAQELVSRGLRLGREKFLVRKFIDKKAICKSCKQLLKEHKSDQCTFRCGNCGLPHKTRECVTKKEDRCCTVCKIPGHDFKDCPVKKSAEKEQVRQGSKSYRDAAMRNFPKGIYGSDRNSENQGQKDAASKTQTRFRQRDWQDAEDTPQERIEVERRQNDTLQEQLQQFKVDLRQELQNVLKETLENERKEWTKALAEVLNSTPGLSGDLCIQIMSRLAGPQTVKPTAPRDIPRTETRPVGKRPRPEYEHIGGPSQGEDTEMKEISKPIRDKRTNELTPLKHFDWADPKNKELAESKSCPIGFDPSSSFSCPICSRELRNWTGYSHHKRTCPKEKDGWETQRSRKVPKKHQEGTMDNFFHPKSKSPARAVSTSAHASRQVHEEPETATSSSAPRGPGGSPQESSLA